MASDKSKTVDEIDDLSEICKVMEALGISVKGLQTLDEMKTRVKKELNQSVEKPSWTPGQVRIRRSWLPNKSECQLTKSKENSKNVATSEISVSLILFKREGPGK